MISNSMRKRLLADQDGNVVIDWAVLLTGALLMTTAVALTVIDRGESVADDRSGPAISAAGNPTGAA